MSDRYRTIAFLFYPESAPFDSLIDKIKDSHIPAFVSPLHAPDDKETKPHYHIMLMFDAQRSVAYLHSLVLSLGGANGYFISPPKRQYARYLLHLDDLDKEQFTDSVIALNGADYKPFLYKSDDEQICSSMSRIIDKINVWHISSFRGLVLRYKDDFDSLNIIRKNCHFFNLYLKKD